LRKAAMICLLLSALISCPSSSAAEGDVFRTGYVCFDLEGNERWSAETEITRSESGRKDVYTLTEKGKGYYSGFKDKVSWTAVLEFESNDRRVRPLRMEKRTFSEEGGPIALEIQEFDFTDERVTCIHEDLSGGTRREKAFRIKGDIANRLILGLYVQKFLENAIRRREIYMLSSEPRLYRIDIKVVGEEELDINGRERAAYKLCLDPDLGLFNMLKVVLPKAYAWHSAVPKFEWLKYVGLEGSVSSPKVEIRTLE